MSNINLKNTKTKLAIIFAFIVFLVSFFLEISFFTIKYYNISYFEKREFNEITNQFNNRFCSNFAMFNMFITEGIKFKSPREGMGKGYERGFKFMNFLVLDNNSNIVAQNINQDFPIKIDVSNINYNNLLDIGNGFLIKKIDISNLGGNLKDIILIKKQEYPLESYFKDIFFFFLITLIFGIFFYYIGIFFVNKNLKPVEETFNDMNDFIHNANHELKTPISVISSNLQLIKATKKLEEDLIEDSIKEIKRIDNLLFELSNFSDINSIGETQNLNLEKEINEIINELKTKIEEEKLTISFIINKNIELKANKEYFYIMFSNLLRNAIKYNIKNGYIKIILDKNKVCIYNSGNGISKDDLPYIFDRFFKGEKSRSTDGFGIGLSLVKKICDIYNWKIKVFCEIGKETIFEIKYY